MNWPFWIALVCILIFFAWLGISTYEYQIEMKEKINLFCVDHEMQEVIDNIAGGMFCSDGERVYPVIEIGDKLYFVEAGK